MERSSRRYSCSSRSSPFRCRPTPGRIASAVLGGEDHTDVARRINGEFRDVSTAAENLPATLTAGREAVFVLGDPLWYHVLDRRQAVEINGWSPQFMTSSQWTELERELRRSRPFAVFISESLPGDVPSDAPDLMGWLESHYVRA